MYRDEEYEALLSRARAREMANRLEIVERCRERIASHKRGPMYWARNFTKTKNYHWQEQGRQPEEPFPYLPYPRAHWESPCDLKHKHSPKACCQARLDKLADYFTHDFTPDDLPDYLDIVMGFLLFVNRLNVPKSREMLTSWSVVLYITYKCQFFDAIEALAQSEKDDKAMGLVKYANILYDNQEPWLREMFPLKRGDAGTLHSIEWANGSSFTAVPEGERQAASHHPSIYFNDESAHQPAYMATQAIVAPVAPQIINVSSVAPGAFSDECGV